MTNEPDPMVPDGHGRAPEAGAAGACSLDELLAVLGSEIDRTWRPEPVAGPPDAVSADGAGELSVQFSCAGRSWAVPTGATVEIRELPPISAVPFTPQWLRGVARAGGEVVAVIDLARFLTARVPGGPGPAGEGEPERETLLVVRSAGKEISAGLAIRGKARLVALAGLPPQAPAATALPRPLQWVTAGVRSGTGGESVAVLDVDRLLRTARAELG